MTRTQNLRMGEPAGQYRALGGTAGGSVAKRVSESNPFTGNPVKSVRPNNWDSIRLRVGEGLVVGNTKENV